MIALSKEDYGIIAKALRCAQATWQKDSANFAQAFLVYGKRAPEMEKLALKAEIEAAIAETLAETIEEFVAAPIVLDSPANPALSKETEATNDETLGMAPSTPV